MDPSKRTSVAERVEWEELGAVLAPEIDATGVVSVCSDVDGLTARACSPVTARFSPSGCTSRRGTLWRDNSLDSSRMRPIHCCVRSLDHINVAHGHSCRPAQLKNHAWEGVSTSGLKGPLMHHLLQQPHEVHLEPCNHGSHQHCTIPIDNVISTSGGK